MLTTYYFLPQQIMFIIIMFIISFVKVLEGAVSKMSNQISDAGAWGPDSLVPEPGIVPDHVHGYNRMPVCEILNFLGPKY